MSQKILFKDGLRVGKNELTLLQDQGQTSVAAIANAFASTLPAVITTQNPDGSIGTECEVTVTGTQARINVGSVLLKDGTLLTVSTPLLKTVPDPSTNAKVILRAAQTPYGKGTMAISAGDRVTLTYTPDAGSTLTAASLYQANQYLRLVNNTTSLGTFRIQSVSVNTVTLAESVPGSTSLSGLYHAPAGKFFPGYPLAGVTTDLLSYDLAEIDIVSSATPLTDAEIELARVTRSGATITITNSRVALTAKGIGLIRDAQVAADAAIQESKIALSAALQTAKANAPLQTGLRDNYTTSSTFRVGGASGPRVLTVDDLPGTATPTATPAVTSVSISPASSTLQASETATLTATANAAPGTTLSYTWSTSDATKATVVGSGNTATVTAVANGSATITCQVSGTAVGSYTAASVNGTAAVTVGSSSTVLRSLTLSQSSVDVLLGGMLIGTQVSVTPTFAVSTISPTVTYNWTSNNTGVCTVSPMPDGGGSAYYIMPVAVGTTTVTIQATAPTTGGYTGNTITTTLTVRVISAQGLGSEPNFRVEFARTSEINVNATVSWGISGSTSGTALNLSMNSGNSLASAISSNQLTGCAFYDSNGRRYLVTANSAAAAQGSFTFTVSKLSVSDPDPAIGGGCWIQSMANGYALTITNASGSTQFYSNPAISATTRSVVVSQANAGATAGTTYLFKLTGSNSTLSPSTRETNFQGAWGAPVAGGSVSVPASWIITQATSSSVKFSWSNTLSGYNANTMDYYVSYRVGAAGSWTVYRRVDDPINLSNIEYEVSGSPNTQISLRLRITALDGQTLINNPPLGYDAEATAYVLGSSSSGGSDMEYVYPFTITGGTTWATRNGVPVYELARYEGPFDTSFTTDIQVVRIDIEFTTPLGAASGSPSVKGVVYPTDNPSYMISGNVTSVSNSTTDILEPLRVTRNGKVTVGIERVGASVPNAGAGRLRVWYRPTNNDGTLQF